MSIDEDNARERDIRQRPPRASGGPFSLKDFADAVGVPEDDPRWDDARRRNQSNVLLPLVEPDDPARCRLYGGTGAGCKDCRAIDVEDREPPDRA